MKNFIEVLCQLGAPSGYEDNVRDYLRNAASTFADEVREDKSGNLLVLKKGRVKPEKTVMLCAHMDEVGLIVRDIEESGFLRFDFLGSVDRRVAIGKVVYLGDARIPGVIGMKPIHLTTPEERETIPAQEELYLDIGAESREEAAAQVELGTYGVFANSAVRMANDHLKVKALDDRAGCGILLTMIKSELPVDTWFAFTVQEEVGARGAFGAAFGLEPDIALVVEGTTAADLPSAKGSERICQLGRGPVLPFMDGGSIYDRQLWQTLTGLADANGIPWQTKTRIAGGTDGQAIQQTRCGCKTAAVDVAVRYIHSPASVADTGDFQKIYDLLMAYLATLEPQQEENGEQA